MISLQPLIDHITPKPEGFALKWFAQVGGAAEYAQIRADALPLPAAWVVRANEAVVHGGEREEEVTFVFDVVIAITNVRTKDKNDTDEALLEYRRSIKTLLLGWEIEPDVRPMQFEGGRVLQYAEGDIYWADKYSFKALVTNYLPDPPLYDSTNYIGDRPS